jgi:hypothetical protein
MQYLARAAAFAACSPTRWGTARSNLLQPEIHTLRVATRHRGYTHTVSTLFADALADLIRPFTAEPVRAQTAPL